MQYQKTRFEDYMRFLAKAFVELDGYAWFKVLRWLKKIYRLPVTTSKIQAVVLS